jgi:energy-coupling factor transporter ATP-binding protein EcfA2
MEAKPLTTIERLRLRAKVDQAFSPSAPINHFALFAGREEQVKAISNAIGVRGRHAILYGDRGVGKTSLVTVLNEIYADLYAGPSGIRIAKVNCDASDDFFNVWRKMFEKIDLIVEGHDSLPEELDLSDLMPEYVGPGEVSRICETASLGTRGLVLIFDEFDCLGDKYRSMFAPTIKDLSDNSVSTTILLVGVSQDVKDLIAEHASVDRCLVQIPMPVMSNEEINQLIDKAISPLDISIEPSALSMIVLLSQGLPHYAHLLGQESAYVAVDDGRKHITIDDVNQGITGAIKNARHSTRTDYQKASEGQRKGTLFPQVLLACAVAPVDDLGYFSSADVRDPLREITGKPYDIPNFAQHLDKLSKDEARGPVLEKLDLGYRLRFRFRNPMLRPFVVMRGLTDGMVTGTLVEKMRSASPSHNTAPPRKRRRKPPPKPKPDEPELWSTSANEPEQPS